MEEIKPVFSHNVVPICFSANDKYVPMLGAEIESIISSSSPKNNYDIVILMTNISDENKVKLLSLISTRPNFSIRFVNVGPYVYGYQFYLESDIRNTRYSDEIYYRVLVPSLMKSYEKVIFLDADLIVLDDIAKLLKEASDDCLISAVRDYEGIANCYDNNYEQTRYRIADLGIRNFESYFASGVIVMNVPKFNEQFDVTTLLAFAISKNWKQFDQDLLNFLCKDSVQIVKAHWNFVEDIYGVYHSMPKHLLNEFIKSEEKPKIIHYSAKRKPWLNADSKYSKYFWEYAEKTPFYDELTSLIVEY